MQTLCAKKKHIRTYQLQSTAKEQDKHLTMFAHTVIYGCCLFFCGLCEQLIFDEKLKSAKQGGGGASRFCFAMFEGNVVNARVATAQSRHCCWPKRLRFSGSALGPFNDC